MSNSTAANAFRGLWVSALLALPVMADKPARPELPNSITTTKRLFAIPFYLNPNSRSPEQIVLFVSGDKGQSWTLYQRRTPAHRKFDFHAGEDGEYWFVVRTTQQAPPTAETLPEKIVIVDQHKPELEMEIELSPEGLLQARWNISDPNLDATTFRLEYQQPDDDGWRPVTVSIPPSDASPSYVGDVSWVLNQADGDVLVRAEVLDEAGNAAVFEKRVRVLSTAAGGVPAERPLADANTTSRHAATAPANSRSNQTPSQTNQVYPDTATVEAGRSEDGPSTGGAIGIAPSTLGSSTLGSSTRPSSATGSLAPEASTLGPSTLGWRTTATGQGQSSLTAPLPTGDSRFGPPEAGFDLFDPLVHPLDSVSRAQVGSAPVQGDYLPPVANQVSPNPSPSQLGRPVSRQVQMTNSRRFNLEYEVADAGDSGVARVELWVTEDDGRTWKAHGTDKDMVSPFLVELDREGTYGFRLLVHNGLGDSAGAPQPGDTADLWVGLDLTPPQARLTSARLGTGLQAGILEIGWVATDANLTDRPIRLSYAEQLEGPWMPIAKPLENSGLYRWQIPEKLTDWVYLKMDVVDRAGNTAQAQLPQPVSTNPVPPSGRIRAISPISDSPQARDLGR